MIKKLIRCKSDEEQIVNVEFTIHKFNSKIKPKNTEDILVLSCFSEFGCETLGCMYCVPLIIKEFSEKYKIAVGWYGRQYLYKHLVDEFWEIKRDHMWLKEYSRAFHHLSKNLSVIERSLESYGTFFSSASIGNVAVCPRCNNCNSYLVKENKCTKCMSENVSTLFGNINFWKSKVKKIPQPTQDKIKIAKKYIKGRCVGIFARGRKCYGRNLQPEFYKKLIVMLESMGYQIIWLGEEVSVQQCPFDHILDLSKHEESKDLELTLSIIKNCEFTIQFWTASTRLSGMVGTPYILFESPDQIWGRGQEGFRRKLCDFGPSKLAISHFLNIFNNNEKGLEIVKRCIEELLVGNYNDIIGDVESEEIVMEMKRKKIKEIQGV
jgi:hypothetical protein